MQQNNILECTNNLIYETELIYSEEIALGAIIPKFSGWVAGLWNTYNLAANPAGFFQQLAGIVGVVGALSPSISKDSISRDNVVIDIPKEKMKIIEKSLAKDPEKVISLIEKENKNFKYTTSKKKRINHIYDIVTSFDYKYPVISKIATNSMNFIKSHPTGVGIAAAIFVILLAYAYIKYKEKKTGNEIGE